MSTPLLHVALIRPEIPGNTGNIGRLCAGLGATLHLVHPLGFLTDEKQVRRAGIDHWKLVDLQEHVDQQSFFDWVGLRRVHLFSARRGPPYTRLSFRRGDVLVFGCESTGLPPELLEAHPVGRLPLRGPVRSLNLANAVAAVSYEAYRQIHPEDF